jgi:hypothetical protein
MALPQRGSRAEKTKGRSIVGDLPVDSRPDTETKVGDPMVVGPTETSYLDLSGDGIPDAVETTQTAAFDVTGDGIPDVVRVTTEIATEIGVDGVPRRVEIVEMIEGDFDHDGFAEDIVTTAVTLEEPGDPAR